MSFEEKNTLYIIGKMYTEKKQLEEKVESIKSEKIESYESQIDALNEENTKLRKQVADLSNNNIVDNSDNVVNLRKRLKDVTEKKDMYRNERYELQRQIKVLNRKIDRMARG